MRESPEIKIDPIAPVELVFRRFTAQEIAQPSAGDLLVCMPCDATNTTQGSAQRVLVDGVAAFPQGPGATQRIIVSADPTLDDLLAAELARILLAGGNVPVGARAFADYAWAVRRGYKPDPLEVPLECSLEGLFQATRRSAGIDLSLPDTSQKFIAKWSLLAQRIMAAAAKGIDPTVTAFRVEGSDFVQERDNLRRDHDVFRQDVRNGDQWWLNIPTDSGPSRGVGLLLRDPKSKFFKYWSRDRQSHLSGEPYLLLAVKEESAKWTFSTDPVLELRLKSLADKLQAAEAAADSAHATQDPWYDGARFQYTLVAAPKSGTVLTETQVLGIFRDWAHASKANGRRPIAIASLAAAAVLLIGAAIMWSRHKEPDISGQTVDNRDIHHTEKSSATSSVYTQITDSTFQKPLVRDLPSVREGSEKQEIKIQPGKKAVATFEPYTPAKLVQAVNLALRLRPSEKIATQKSRLDSLLVEVQVNNKPLELTAAQRQDESEGLVLGPLEARFLPGENSVKVTAFCDDGPGQRWNAILDWSVDVGRLPNLYVLAVGISRYESPKYQLHYAAADAQSLGEFFAKDKDLLFRKVTVQTLVDEAANHDNVIKALHQVKQHVSEDDLVIVSVSGHGDQGNGGQFYFLPWGWDCPDPSQYEAQLDLAAVAGRQFIDALGQLPCHVLLVLDTCHSGAATTGEKGVSLEDDLPNAIEKAVQRWRSVPKGIVVLAACLADEKANEKAEWGHGVLTLALLEGLRGKVEQRLASNQLDRLPTSNIVSLEDLKSWISHRVTELTKGEQAVTSKSYGDIKPELIPMMTHERAALQSNP